MKNFASIVLFALGATVVSADSKITFLNKCEYQVDLYDNEITVPMAPGAAIERVLPGGFHGMFRHGANPEATLAEFTIDGGRAWFDISIIPTSKTKGPDFCESLGACKLYTGGTGFNIPMQITPQTAHIDVCRELTCEHDGCADAYQFPKDDTKTHSCVDGTEFIVKFCPSGHGGETPAPTPAPTPEPTPEPTTPAPTTPAPTLNATEDGSMDALEEAAVISMPMPLPTTKKPTPSPTPAPTEAPVVEANTQSGADSSSPIGTIMVVLLGVVAAAGVAVIVVVRRKKAQLDAMENKDSIIFNDATAAL